MKKAIAIILTLVMSLSMIVSAADLNSSNPYGTTTLSLQIDTTYTVSIPDSIDLSTDNAMKVSVTDAMLPPNTTLNLTISSSNYNEGWYCVDKYSSNNTLPYSIKNGSENVKSGDAVLSLEAGIDTSASATLNLSYEKPKVSGNYRDTLTFKVDLDGGYVRYPAAEGLAVLATKNTATFEAYSGTIAGEKDVMELCIPANDSWNTQIGPHLIAKGEGQSFDAVRNNLKKLGYKYAYVDFCITDGGVSLMANAVDNDENPTVLSQNIRMNLNTVDGTIAWQGSKTDNEKTYITVLDSNGDVATSIQAGVWYTAKFKLQIYMEGKTTYAGFCGANDVGGTIYLGEVRYE